MGITATPSNQLAAQGADVVCVVVKPWFVEQVLKSIKDVLDYDQQMLVVVAAGIKWQQHRTWLDKGRQAASHLPGHSQYRHCPAGSR